MLGYLSTDIICSEKRIVLRILSAHCLWRHFGTPSCTHILKTWRVILVPRGRAPFGQHQESQPLTRSKQRKIHGLPVTLRMLKVNSDKSDWFLSQSIVFTKPLIIHAALTRPEHLILVRWMGLETQWKASWKHGRVWNPCLKRFQTRDANFLNLHIDKATKTRGDKQLCYTSQLKCVFWLEENASRAVG